MSRGAVKGGPRRESRTGQRPPPGQARAVSRSPGTPVLSLFPRGRAQRREWVPRSWADPSVHDKHLLKVFPVVSVINGPLTKSMDQVSRVNLQETLLRACPTPPVTQSAAGGEGELCGLGGWGAGLRGELPPGPGRGRGMEPGQGWCKHVSQERRDPDHRQGLAEDQLLAGGAPRSRMAGPGQSPGDIGMQNQGDLGEPGP